LKCFSSQAQSRTVLQFTHPLSTVYRKLFGSGIFVYWFILRRFCNGIDCVESKIRMLANDELVIMLEATVVYFNTLPHCFSVGDEEEILSLLHTEFSFPEVKLLKCKTDHSLHVMPGLRNLGGPICRSVGRVNCCWPSPAVIVGSEYRQTDVHIVCSM
jgi:hypothetical protein